MHTASTAASPRIHRRGRVRTQIIPAAKAAQVCPDGKELGSGSFTRGISPATWSQGRSRPTRCLSTTLVHSSPSSMENRASSPAFLVGFQHSMRTDSTIHKIPAFPSRVKHSTTGFSQSRRRP